MISTDLKQFIKTHPGLIIICDNAFNQELFSIRRQDPLLEFTFLTPSDVINAFSYLYSWDGVNFLIKEKNFTYDKANEILKVLSYVNFSSLNLDSNNSVDNYILENFFDLQKELINKGFLRENSSASLVFKDKDILYYEIKNTDALSRRLSGIVRSEQKILFDTNGSIRNRVISFPDKFDEVHYVLNEMAHLINGEEAVKPNNISLYVADNTYMELIKLFAGMYGLKFAYPNNAKIYESQLYKSLRQKLELLEDFTLDNIKKLMAEHQESFSNDANINKLVLNIHAYFDENLNKPEQLALYDDIFKSISYNEIYSPDAIKIISKPVIKGGNTKFFVLGFKNTSYPAARSDNDFINDNIKKKIGLFTTKDVNENEKHKLLKFLMTEDIHLITYDTTADSGVGISYLVNKFIPLSEEDNRVVIESQDCHQDFEYSEDAAKVIYKILANNKEYDDKRYKSYHEKITLPENYDNAFTGIYNHRLSGDRRLSASGVKDFVVCPYKYYLQHILHLKNIGTNFYAVLGTICHRCNEIVTLKELNNEIYDIKDIFEESLSLALEKNELSNLEITLIKNLYPYLEEQIHVTQQHDFKQLNDAHIEIEKPFETKFITKGNNKITLNGKIDKLIKYNDHYIIYDYKTSNRPSDEVPSSNNGVEFERLSDKMRFSMQLPFYHYCITKMIEEGKMEPGDIYGLLISRIFPSKDKIDTDPNLDKDELDSFNDKEIKKYYERYRSCGLISNDVSLFNNLIGDTMYFKKSKKTMLEKEDFEVINKYTEDMINDLDESITNGMFEIEPVVQSNSEACRYCDFKDICFNTQSEKEFVYTEKDKLEFNKKYYPNLAEEMAKAIEEKESGEDGNDKGSK